MICSFMVFSLFSYQSSGTKNINRKNSRENTETYIFGSSELHSRDFMKVYFNTAVKYLY